MTKDSSKTNVKDASKSGKDTSFGDISLSIGLMSGTSLDGIDVAAIRTDGQRAIQFGPGATFPYDDDFRDDLRSILGPEAQKNPDTKSIEEKLTALHALAVGSFMDMYEINTSDVNIIGFHGHTIFHDPKAGVTHQLGNAQMLADITQISVVADFRSQDVLAGGEGAPLVPIYHQALVNGMNNMTPPVAVLNLGGIANVTWIGPEGGGTESELLAFDTGPCNALLDDWTFDKTGKKFDEGGSLAASGKANTEIINSMLSHPYFSKEFPKSLDRLDFNTTALKGLSPEDGAATLVGFIAAAVKKAENQFPQSPNIWVLTGGGCHNNALVKNLSNILSGDVVSADEIGWSGDAMEAQAFAYLAVRSIKGLAISFPGTTGVTQPISGGTRFNPAGKKN